MPKQGLRTLSDVTTRRDRCLLFGRRMEKLTPMQAWHAWRRLAAKLRDLGDKDVPKFNDLLIAIDTATRMERMTPEAKRIWLEKRKTNEVLPTLQSADGS
jgi:phosphoglycerate-specific signal transduction histidine kinase